MSADPDVRRALLNGDASVVGVGQGPISMREALPRQYLVSQVARGWGARKTLATVDKDGERGVLVIPKLKATEARALGALGRQRSVIYGNKELAVTDGEELTRFEGIKFHEHGEPWGEDDFFTEVPYEGLSFALVQVRPHQREGRLVRGYATRRLVRSGGEA